MYIPPHIHNQYTCIYHPYTQSIYMYIPPVCTINIHVYTTLIHNQYTCIYHPCTQSIYMYIAPIYTMNIHVYTTLIHNQYTCIYHPCTQSIYMYIPPYTPSKYTCIYQPYDIWWSKSKLWLPTDMYIQPHRHNK